MPHSSSSAVVSWSDVLQSSRNVGSSNLSELTSLLAAHPLVSDPLTLAGKKKAEILALLQQAGVPSIGLRLSIYCSLICYESGHACEGPNSALAMSMRHLALPASKKEASASAATTAVSSPRPAQTTASLTTKKGPTNRTPRPTTTTLTAAAQFTAPSSSSESVSSKSREMRSLPPSGSSGLAIVSKCRAKLLNNIEDYGLQLARPGTGATTYVHVARRRNRQRSESRLAAALSTGAPPSSLAHPSSSYFDEDDDIFSPLGGGDGNDESFRWVDVVGTWDSSTKVRFKQSAFRRTSAAFADASSPLKQMLLSSFQDDGGDNDDQHQGYQTLGRGGRARNTSLEEVLSSLERELRIELPLATICRRLQGASAHDGGGSRTRSVVSTTTFASQKAALTARIRQRVEEGVNLGYFCGTMFRETEDNDVKETTNAGGVKTADCHAAAAAAGGSAGPTSSTATTTEDDGSPTALSSSATVPRSTTAEGKREQDTDKATAAAAEDLAIDHQHILVISVAASPLRSASSLLPPAGSEQRSHLLKTHLNNKTLTLASLLQDAQYNGKAGTSGVTEKWVVYIDTRTRVVVTVRPTDCLPIARIRAHFDTCFQYLSLDEFVSFLSEAVVVQYKSHLEEMDMVLDECQQMLAPKGADGDEAGDDDEEAKARRRQRQKTNIVVGKAEKGSVKDALYKFQASMVRGWRSVLRKLSRSRWRKRDTTIAALRLMSSLNRQASVYDRCLAQLKSSIEVIGGGEDGNDTTDGASSNTTAAPRRHIHRHKQPTKKMTNTSEHCCGHAIEWQSVHRHNALGLVAHHGPTSCHSAACVSSCRRTIIDECECACDELSERCSNLRHMTTELMNLGIALDAEHYDEGLAIVSIVTAVFAPFGYVCSNMGVNFRVPMFHLYYGYYGFWAFFVGVSVLIVTWFLKKYYDFSVVQWLSAKLHVRERLRAASSSSRTQKQKAT